MAEAIPKRDWLEIEDVTRRCYYWEFLVQHWLWNVPFAVLSDELGETRMEAPSPQALQDFGWVVEERESELSH